MKTKTTYQSYNAAKAVPRGKCIATNTLKNQISNQETNLQLKKLETEQMKPKAKRRKELKIRE